jgi:hypothetical protein
MTDYENRLRLDGPAEPIYSPQQTLLGPADVVGWKKGDLEIEVINRDLANDIIRQNHYSGKVYNASYIHLGAFWDGQLIGVAQYGYAMNPTSQEGVVPGTGPKEYLELNRLWVDDGMPGNSESAILSLTLKFIKATTPVRWVQSFADERCRLFGGVYQACSFLYCGEHTAVFWEIDGRWFHNSIMTRDPKLTPAARWAQENRERATPHNLRQFRYVKFLRPKYRRDLALPTYPYPKPHADGVEETTPANQPGSVGAMPTLRSHYQAEKA